MATPSGNAALAYSYAWWLIGDQTEAETVAREATVRCPEGDRVALLEAVRSGAVQARTMCPASELALLHDGHGLSLSEAAKLARIDDSDALVELAHGRLEALLETVRDPFEHPERLGGLAVGNPPDVAHARQCQSCASVQSLLVRGREELRALPAPDLPNTLTNGHAASADTIVDDRTEAATPAPPASRAEPETESAPPPDTEPVAPLPGSDEHAPGTDELADQPLAQPDTDQPSDAPTVIRVEPASPPRRRWRVLIAVALLALAAIAGSVLLGDPDPESPPPAPTGADPGDASELDTQAPAQDPVVTPDGFAVEEAALVRREGGPPLAPGVTLEPGQPVRVAVQYRGAIAGVVLDATWLVDGEPFRDLRVVLTSRRSTHVFGASPPPDGWPTGRHQVLVSVDGDIVANVDFRVE